MILSLSAVFLKGAVEKSFLNGLKKNGRQLRSISLFITTILLIYLIQDGLVSSMYMT